MNKKPLALLGLILASCILATANMVYADIHTDVDFAISYTTGESFVVEDPYRSTNVTFTVVSGNLTGTGNVNLDSAQGNYTFRPTSSCIVNITAIGITSNSTTFTLTVNSVAKPPSSNLTMTSGGTYFVQWYTTSAAPTSSPSLFSNSIDTDYLWQFLYNYDIIGFIIACWTADLGESFYVIISMIVTLAFYIKLKNLTVMAVMWFILGFLWVGFIPIVSPIIFLLFIFGLASLIFKIYGESKY